MHDHYRSGTLWLTTMMERFAPIGDTHLLVGLYGVSGSGKSTVMKILGLVNKALTVHTKDSTRKPGTNEDDLRCISEDEFRANEANGVYELIYYKYGNYYGIRRDQLRDAFECRSIHCIIIRDITALQILKRRYRLRALYFHADPETAVEHIRRRDREDPEQRLLRLREEYKEFIDHNTLFDHVIVNFWDVNNALLQLQRLFELWDRQQRLI
ncbi:MAG: hypothetical protein SFV54_25015 [Bryobacteraceae bacterium]|nr:hypothetical protein [Bryobacteraceae bacterium]